MGQKPGETGAERSIHWSWAAVLSDPVRLAILRTLCEVRSGSAAELQARSHISDHTVRRHLEALEALDLVRETPGERDGLTPGRPARRFTIDADVAMRLKELFALISEPLGTDAEPTPGPRGDQ